MGAFFGETMRSRENVEGGDESAAAKVEVLFAVELFHLNADHKRILMRRDRSSA